MDDDALRDLLSQPLELEPPERGRWWIAGLVGLALFFVVAFVLLSGDDQPVGATTSPGSAIVTTSITIAVPTTTPVSSFQYPDGRIAGTLVYDPTVDGVVMLGGWTVFRDPPVLDPWVFDSADRTWISIMETLEPSGRELAPAVFVDSLSTVAVLGGTPEQTMQCGRFSRALRAPVDVWYLDTSARAWDRAETGGSPPDRWGHGSAYDPNSDVIVVFGGVGTELGNSGLANLRGDTWIFDPTTATWTEVVTDTSPTPRACTAMVYDEAGASIVLWGGTTTSGEADRSVWSFDTETLEWTEFAPTDDTGPAGRWMHQMVVVDGRAFVIGGLFPQVSQIEGGTTTQVEATDELWALDLATLQWDEMRPIPAALWGHAAAFDGTGSIVVSAFGSTVIYDPVLDEWTDITPYDELDWESERRLFGDG